MLLIAPELRSKVAALVLSDVLLVPFAPRSYDVWALDDMAALVDEAAALFSRAAQGPEGQEGTGAFLQKRKPNWVPA